MSGIQDKLAGLTPEQRAFVELQLQKTRAGAAPPSIPRRAGDRPPALSFAQQRLWLLSQLDPASPAYVMPGAVRLTGPLNLDALGQALDGVAARHEALRTTFALESDEPIQVVRAEGRVPVETVDLRGLPPEAGEAEARRLAIAWSRQPFDLERGPLLRAQILALGPEDHVLLVAAHHIVSDGWSMAIFVRELGEIYRALDAGRAPALDPLPIQYADFAVWQRDHLSGDRLASQLDYWTRALSGAPQLQLPLDRPRPPVPTPDGAVETLVVPADVAGPLRALSQREGATLFMTLLAGFNVLLARYCGQEDVVVGSPIANRTRAEVEGLIGCFVNLLAFRTDLSGDPTARELLGRVRETALGAFAHQDLPFERLVDELQPERSVSQNPLCSVVFALQNAPSGRLDLGRVVLTAFEFPLTTTRFDLEMHVAEREGALAVRACYRTDLFDADTVRRLLRHYAALLRSMAAAPDERVSRLSMIDHEERRQLAAVNATVREYPRDRHVHRAFERQADLAPDAPALVWRGEHVTYAALNARANRLARLLRAQGVGPDDRVALFIERSPAYVAGALAALKAGAAYVPLDPAYPADRLSYMLSDCGARLVLTTRAMRPHLPPGGFTPIVVDEGAQDSGGENLEAAGGPLSLAYVIYTSGSTGRPKGVALSHRGLMNLVCWHHRAYAVTPGDRAALIAGLGFDASVWEIWPYLTAGASVHIPDDDTRSSAETLLQWLADSGVTICFAPTPMAEVMVQSALPRQLALRALLTGGDTLHAVPGGLPFTVYNNYGPTENTVVATWTPVPRAGAASPPPIGRPVDNCRVHVLDRSLNAVAVGVPGELYIGGDSLARGYLGQPALTAERFVPDPFGGEPGGRLYRTGDLVRLRADGQLEFLGRTDHQVKIRGFRIELGEIEAALRGLPGIDDAVVVVREDDGDRRLVGYVVPAGASPAWADIRVSLRARLPDYMIPAAFVALDALPVNANGKIDRRALPAPAAERQLGDAAQRPRSELERQIASVWRDVLKLDEIGVADNFFDVGGHSLRLLQVHRELVKRLGRDVPIVDLFRFPTVAALAAHLGGGAGTAPAWAANDPRGRQPERPDAVAIVAMAGRFPGAPDVETFWENLRAGVESIRHFSEDELRKAGVGDAVLANPRFVGAHGALDGIDLFDAAFFGYSAREAEQIDPQQRLFLECAWEALERAGYDPQGPSRAVGVFAGSTNNFYLLHLLSRPGASAAGTVQAFIGTGADFLSTRVSYKLNLRGPSVTVQTACSTSLVAVHEACQSLRRGECDLALAGGASVKLSGATGYLYEDEGILSPDGHCRAFDAKARGTVGGSGVGVVLLKRLSEALADGDTIHAVIRGSAINNDGSDKVGYTAPSVHGQAAVIGAACAAGGVDPATIGYVEAHGTGTILGDPIELEALTQVFGRREGARPSCAIGSVKSNVGHLDAAAGVTGLIKAALALSHGEIPPSLHYESPNPRMPLEGTPFYVSDRLHAWPAGSTPRRAGVSSFGIGGTNVHVVLEEAPARGASDPGRPVQLIVLSARSPQALERATDDLAAWCESSPAAPLADAAFTLQTGRHRFRHRRIAVCENVEDLRRALRERDPRRVWTAESAAGATPVAFVFPGQGAQAVNMGRGLFESEDVFRASIERCAALLRPHADGDVLDVLYPGVAGETAAARVAETVWSQPALFAVEYALAELWRSWGVRPRSMIGHSLGEYVAACLAGVWSLEDALALVAARGRLMQALPAGAMLAVAAGEADIRTLAGEPLAIAAVNGPSAVVLSGPIDAIEEAERRCVGLGFACRRLVTSRAFHSSMLDPILPAFRAQLSTLRFHAPEVPYVSNVTGTWITAADATDPDYWVAHLRRTVRFGDGLSTILADESIVPLEVGPGRGLTSLARGRLAGTGRPAVASLPSRGGGVDDLRGAAEALGRLWLAGVPVDWNGYHAGARRRRVLLPTYPFERRRYWVDPAPAATPPAGAPGAAKRPSIDSWLYKPSWRPAPLAAGLVPPPGPALVFADRDSVGDGLARRLGRAAIVRRADRFARLGADEYEIDPLRRDDYERLFADLASAGRFPACVVHAWEASASDGADGFSSLLGLSQALAAAGRPAAVHVVGCGVHAISAAERLAPRKAMMAALLRVVSQEHPRLRGRSIDICLPGPAWEEARLLDQLVRELAAGPQEFAVAYRGHDRYIESFEQVSSGGGPLPLRDGGVYLITGGLGSIGLTLAEHLVTAVRARVVLVGRTALPPRDRWQALLAAGDTAAPLRRRLERLRRLESAGADLLIVQADVARVDEVRRAIDAAERRFGAVHGVFHGAAVTGADVLRPIDSLPLAECERQFAPKVEATISIEQALAGRPLDFCLLMSSLSTVLGGLGFGAYAPANAFMDAFAHEHNRRDAVPWVSVAWDGWTMNAASASPSAAAALAMTHEEGIQALSRVLRMQAAGRVLVSTADLPARVRQWAGPSGGQEPPAGDAVTLHERPATAADYIAPRDETERAIAAVWQALLGIDRVGAGDNFFELGGHSLLALQVISRVREQLGASLSVHDIFNAPTLSELAAVVRSAGRDDARLARIEELLEMVEGLPEEDVKHLLPADAGADGV